jgi:hypothetical protein
MAKPTNSSEFFLDQLLVQIRIHLQTVGGIYITSGYIVPTTTPIPGFKTWVGYTIPPNPPAEQTENIPNGGSVPEQQGDETKPKDDGKKDSDTKTNVSELEPLQFGNELSNQAKIVVEEYYGKPISDDEFQLLIRALAGESGGGDLEDAAIASVILNRAKTNFGKWGGIKGQLYAKNQFQAVTGAGGSGASKSFLNPTDKQIARVTNNILNNLKKLEVKSWLNFTAENPAAYGAGTNSGFRTRALNTPGMQIIGTGRNKTIFFTERRA